MDPEKFDKVLLDVLYDEVDEVTRAAAERHMGQSERARRLFDDLRAAREVGQIPILDVPPGLTTRILDAERRARAQRSLASRAGGAISLLAGYAMRPQLAMAAVLMLMLGSSLLLLRARPGARDSVQVTERGVPETESESVTLMPLPHAQDSFHSGSPPSPAHGPVGEPPPPARGRVELGESSGGAATPAGDSLRRSTDRDEELAFPSVNQEERVAAVRTESEPPSTKKENAFDDAMSAYRAGRYAEAKARFNDVARSGDPNAASAELFSARATQRTDGCGEAIPKFEAVARKHAGTGIAHEALWLSAECRREVGDAEGAARDYQALLDVPNYSTKARAGLAAMSRPASATSFPSRSAAGAGAASKPAAAPAPESATD
jgi:hypothetical protein